MKVALVSLTLSALVVAASLPAAAISCPGCTGASTCPPPSPCPANALHVSLPVDQPKGSSALIQTAVNRARAGAVICVDPGIYYGPLVFSGQSVTVLSSTPLGAILQGTGGSVVTFVANDASTLDGFQISGGTGNGGGGILINNSSPTIQNCLVQGNSVVDGINYGQGGGAYIGGSKSAPLIRCTCFSGNHASHTGGGLTSTYLAHPYLSHVTFVNNTADYGAGVAVEFDGLANIENSEFLTNSANVDGGALHVLSPFGHVNMRRTVILGNTASSNGGGLWIPAGFATVLNSVFDGNQAYNGGGASAGFNGVLTVESTLFVNNASMIGTLTSDAGPTTVINNYNLFFNNSGATYAGTSGNLGILTADPLFANACYSLSPSSPALHTGLPDIHFENTDSTQNSMGMYGGPTLP